MARRKGQSLGRKDVVAAGLACIQEEGPEALNVNRVAHRLGIRTPSLYNHVDGADDLRRAVVLEVLERAGREIVFSEEDQQNPRTFIRALAHGLRRFAIANANLYLFMMAAPVKWDTQPFSPHWSRNMEAFSNSVQGFGFSGVEHLHAARFALASIQGFIRLELRGSLAEGGHEDASFEWMLDGLFKALEAMAPRGQG